MPIDTSLDFVPINIAIITISDSRTKENDGRKKAARWGNGRASSLW